MRIVITERQLNNLISPNVEGLEDLMNQIIDKFPEVEDYKDRLIDFINKSNCQKIEFATMQHAGGLSLHNSVLLNKILLNRDLNSLIFIIFHEIAHQYQFKKYGAEKMYELYTGKIHLEDAVDFLYNTEITADEFAFRKVKEFHKLGLLKTITDMRMYKKMGKHNLANMYNQVKKILSVRKGDSPDEVSEVLYNFIKIKIE
jgi:hypothetical protein